jgi:hypothetical protein
MPRAQLKRVVFAPCETALILFIGNLENFMSKRLLNLIDNRT